MTHVFSLFLAEYALIVFRHQFSRKELEQVQRYQGESRPVESCIDWDTRYCTDQGENGTQERLIEEIGE